MSKILNYEEADENAKNTISIFLASLAPGALSTPKLQLKQDQTLFDNPDTWWNEWQLRFHKLRVGLGHYGNEGEVAVELLPAVVGKKALENESSKLKELLYGILGRPIEGNEWSQAMKTNRVCLDIMTRNLLDQTFANEVENASRFLTTMTSGARHWMKELGLIRQIYENLGLLFGINFKASIIESKINGTKLSVELKFANFLVGQHTKVSAICTSANIMIDYVEDFKFDESKKLKIGNDGVITAVVDFMVNELEVEGTEEELKDLWLKGGESDWGFYYSIVRNLRELGYHQSRWELVAEQLRSFWNPVGASKVDGEMGNGGKWTTEEDDSIVILAKTLFDAYNPSENGGKVLKLPLARAVLAAASVNLARRHVQAETDEEEAKRLLAEGHMKAVKYRTVKGITDRTNNHMKFGFACVRNSAPLNLIFDAKIVKVIEASSAYIAYKTEFEESGTKASQKVVDQNRVVNEKVTNSTSLFWNGGINTSGIVNHDAMPLSPNKVQEMQKWKYISTTIKTDPIPLVPTSTATPCATEESSFKSHSATYCEDGIEEAGEDQIQPKRRKIQGGSSTLT